MDALQRELDGKASSRSQFSSPPPPAGNCPIRFSPPRFAPDLVSATQYDDDMESDSLASHSSRTPRKRLFAPWQIISVKQKSSHSKEEVFDSFTELEIAVDDLAKAGPCEDVRPSVEDLGGFKRAHVSRIFLVSDGCNDVMTACFVHRVMYPVQELKQAPTVGNGIVLIGASVIAS